MKKYQYRRFYVPEKQQFKRSRLDINKCEHFLDFVFNSGLLQDVAYGVTTIEFDSGWNKRLHMLYSPPNTVIQLHYTDNVSLILIMIHCRKFPGHISQSFFDEGLSRH